METKRNKVFIIIDKSDDNNVLKVFSSYQRAKEFVNKNIADTLIIKQFFIN